VKHKTIFASITVFLLSVCILFFYKKYFGINYLTFSDGAKYADIARNIFLGHGYGSSFSFWDSGIAEFSRENLFSAIWIPPVTPLLISLSYKIMGISDFSVITISSVFFVLSVFFTFLLGKKLFGNLVGFLSAVTVMFNESLILYGLNGGSESLFIFEIIAIAYFITLKNKWATFLSLIFMILMYFTRPQGFIYIVSLILYWFLTNFKTKKSLTYFFGIVFVGVLVDRFLLTNMVGKYFLYPILARGKYAFATITSSSSDVLRGMIGEVTIVSILKKIFYNLYNFYKLLPQIISPYMFVLFLVSLFYWTKNRLISSFKFTVIIMVFLTFVVTAVSIPFFRYIHPIIPFVYIIASEMLVLIFRKFAEGNQLIKKDIYINFVTFLLIFIFCVGQTLGVIFLDSRFKSKLVNIEKPPVYVTLSKILKENTNSDQLILTNLDTWGSWYGDRRTVWYPVTPDMIIPTNKQENSLDVIYLTSYLMDDENYYMGEEWKQIFLDPKNIKNEYIYNNYKFEASFDVKAEDVYENYSAKAVLLVRK